MLSKYLEPAPSKQVTIKVFIVPDILENRKNASTLQWISQFTKLVVSAQKNALGIKQLYRALNRAGLRDDLFGIYLFLSNLYLTR